MKDDMRSMEDDSKIEARGKYNPLDGITVRIREVLLVKDSMDHD